MSVDIARIAAGINDFWSHWGAPVILVVGITALGLIGFAAVRFARTRDRSKVVSTITAAVVMAWTSEGLLEVALRQMRLPLPFALMTFFVFEAMMLSAAMRAEEHRAAKGVPGPAGRYVFLLAVCSGIISAFGADTPGVIILRVILPPLAVGLWWIGLTAERSSDTEAMRAERARLAAEREATWVWTPRTLLVQLGLMKPGTITVTQAQREHRTRRMVILADRAACTTGWPRDRAVRRLRKLTREADDAMVTEVAARASRARRAEELMVAAGDSLDGQATFSAGSPEFLGEKVETRKSTRETKKSASPAEKVEPKKSGTRIGRPSAAEKVAGYLGENPGAGVAEVAEKVGVHEDTARKYLRELEATFPVEPKKSSHVNGVKPSFVDVS